MCWVGDPSTTDRSAAGCKLDESGLAGGVEGDMARTTIVITIDSAMPQIPSASPAVAMPRPPL